MNPQTDQKDSFQQYINKAWRALAAARRNYDAGDYDFAVSRSYYAAYYCMSAALLSIDLSFSKHTATIGAFNKHFVKEGVFPKTFGKFINQLFSERQTGDYAIAMRISPNDAIKNIEIAKEMVQVISEYLNKQGR